MENPFILLITAIFTAIAAENLVFTRALGLNKTVMIMNHPKLVILYGTLVTWMMTASSLFTAVLNRLLIGQPLANYLYAPGYLLCACGVLAFTYLYTRKQMPAQFAVIRHILPATTFNSAVFGVFYITNGPSYGFLQTIGYAFGAGVGFTLAILIIYYARKRLAISPVPRSFRGMPILLLYIGFLSLAIYGLIGHGLPS